MFMFMEPGGYPSKTSYKNLINIIIHSLYSIRFRAAIINLSILAFKILIDFLKIIYLPIIIIFYFSKYRFIQMNYSQIGTLNDNFNIMVKKNLLEGYKSIILIPSSSNFNFTKEIFKNLIIIDNYILNILLLPLKHSRIISCLGKDVSNSFLDINLKLINFGTSAKIFSNYTKKIKKKYALYDFKYEFEKEMKLHIKRNYPHIKLKKTFTLHQRENFFGNTSHLRGSRLSTYIPSIRYLLNSGYNVIRLTNSNSKKLTFKNQAYKEINTDVDINKKFQYYLISKCRGFICSDSGPSSMGTLFSTPVYQTNVQGTIMSGFSKESLFLPKKIKLKKKLISFKKAIDLDYFSGHYLCINYLNKHGFKTTDNTKSELLDGIKEFENLNKKVVQTNRQKKFKEYLPEYFELRHYKSNISDSFIRSNIKLFS